MRKLLDSLYTASGYLAAACIGLICLVVAIQVMFNLIDRIAGGIFDDAIGLTIPSYSDFTGFFLAAASFLALAYTLRGGAHIRVTLFTGILSPKIQRTLEIWCVGLAMCMTCYISWYAISLVLESWHYDDMSSGMIAVPIWIPQSAMAAGLVVLAISLIDEFIGLLRGHKASYHGKGENLLDNEVAE